MSDNITSGTVTVEDAAKKPGEGDPQYWLSKNVRVELSFEVFQEEDGAKVLDVVSRVAQLKVAEMLGMTTVVAASSATEDKPAATRTRRTKEQIAADKAAEDAKASPPADVGAVEPGDEWGDDSGEAKADKPADEPTEDWASDDAPAAEITDADLNSATQKRNTELGDNGVSIRKLIQSFKADPNDATMFQLRQIPQEKRQGYLDKLAALTKPA